MSDKNARYTVSTEPLRHVDAVCKSLKECAYYVVEVELYDGNARHKVILYTGFRNGGYRCLLCATYDNILEPRKAMIHVLNWIEDLGFYKESKL